MVFLFKQFTIEDDQSSMKVGTDAVLIGAWAGLHNANNILEIGCGSGVISLMFAQRTNAIIDTIDIDIKSVGQANHNFKQSKWASQLNAFPFSLQEFQKESNNKYDLIISNPPYFNNSLISPFKNKTLSKHTITLNYNEILEGIKHFLSNNGKTCLILPYTEGQEFIELATKQKLYLNRQLLISPKIGKNPNRIIMEFSYYENELKTEEICLRKADNQLSEAYKLLCKDYYLNL
jgi:tRNA1Val (adenine37-N6)-methyltransferase